MHDTEENIADTIEKFNLEDIPSSSFNLVLGKRRSGKSYLVEDLIQKMVKNKMLDAVFLFSGTDAGFPDIEPEFRFIGDDMSPLNQLVENMKYLNEFNKVAPKKDKIKIRVAVILDDHAVNLKSKGFNILETLAVNGRHTAYDPMALHVFTLCQSLTKIPRVVRLNSDLIIFNSIASLREKECIMDENLYLIESSLEGKRRARKLYDDVMVKAPFIFMVILNCKQNVVKYSDYIRTYVADAKKKK